MAVITKTTERVIGLWYDDDSEPGVPAWIISRDDMNERGEAETTDTEEWRNVNENADAYEQAKEVAFELAREKGLRVIQTNEDHSQECVYAPKLIHISDGIQHSKVIYKLHSDTLEQVSAGGCPDILNDFGCGVDDTMSDEQIVEIVWDTWTSDTYDGDPYENGLVVKVEPMKGVAISLQE